MRKRQKMISLCDESFKHADSMRNFSAFVRKKTLEDKNQDAPEDFRLFSDKRMLVIAMTRLQNMGNYEDEQMKEAVEVLLKVIKQL